jgi:predicted pyridoxine 5'-phosphate oxidase superfamily flavin-nucleotide-binding protein
MPRAFSSITYTPSVKRAQEQYGTREANQGFDTDTEQRKFITPRDADFIDTVETFFMATVGETGWPYVQHRGGPRGFLKVIDAATLGFADFRGNGQYVSTGNLDHDGRSMLILMDFARRIRLKIWGRARMVDARTDPELIAKLKVEGYRARVERGCLIAVEALDFNCPQHIVQRFSADELKQMAQDPDSRAALFQLMELTAPPAN